MTFFLAAWLILLIQILGISSKKIGIKLLIPIFLIRYTKKNKRHPL